MDLRLRADGEEKKGDKTGWQIKKDKATPARGPRKEERCTLWNSNRDGRAKIQNSKFGDGG